MFVHESQTVCAIELRTVALSGQHAAGTDPGAVFADFNAPLLNEAEQVAFQASLQEGVGGVTSNDIYGIWSGALGAVGLVARGGTQAPGAPAGTKFISFVNQSFAMSSTGHVAFSGYILAAGSPSSAYQTGIWAEQSGQLTMLARIGSQPAGLPAGAMYTSLLAPLIDAAGNVSFVGNMLGGVGGVTGDNSSGLWSTSGGALGLRYRQGDQVPSEINGVKFGAIQSASMNSTGRTTFSVPPSHVGDVAGVWSEGMTPPGFMAYVGAVAPGTSPGIRFDGMGTPSINDAGQVAFRGTLTGGPLPSKFAAVDNGIWVQRNGGLSLIARQGNAAVGEPAGAVFDSFLDHGVLNGTGNVAFRGSVNRLTSGHYMFSNYGIWSERGGAISLVAYEGAQAVGMANGTTYSHLDDDSFNDRGQVAFDATLLGSGSGIWAQDSSGVLHLIAATGQQLDVDDGPGINIKTIAGVAFAGASSGTGNRGGGFNNRGDIAFTAYFSDGTFGVFISDAVAVPEPGAISLAVWGISVIGARATLVRIRRRKYCCGECLSAVVC